MTTPFRRVPYDRIPAKPRRPHRFLSLPEQRVTVETPALGPVSTSFRTFGSGPPLLLVHGLMTTGYTWRYALEPLGERFTVVVPDLVGAGRTDKPDRPLTPEAVSDWLVGFQRAVGIGGCAAIANSMGGYLALWAAARHPDAFCRLVVVHAPGVPEARLWALWALMRIPGSRAALGALVRRDPRRWIWRNVHYADETLKSVEELAEYGDVLATPEGLGGFWRQLRDVMDARAIARFAEVLPRVRTPVRLVYARRDPMVSPRVGPKLAAAIPGAELVWLEHGSHFAQVDATATFVDAVLPFLEQAPPLTA